ncbi:hypothetical protein [Haloferula sargassicola]
MTTPVPLTPAELEVLVAALDSPGAHLAGNEYLVETLSGKLRDAMGVIETSTTGDPSSGLLPGSPPLVGRTVPPTTDS